ncbi:PREDICTED: myb-like protein N isoform X2 [Nicotiana attenuata]|uniref:myb-like protein N isoform X2 n=1 Tax=Nicotiana attenuata TaxID=49451 RepID=UPI0009051E87|nr:PREDICTED: myb-like protein N isoform X2 [Nicotiana attenuata]
MLKNMANTQEHQLSIEEMSSPLSDQILNFCESELFPNVQNSEVASSSNCCSYEEQSSYSTNLDMNKFNNTIEKNEETNITTVTSNISPSRTNNNNNNDNNNNINNNALSIIFDSHEDQIENDISASIEFTQDANFSIPHHLLNPQQELFDINSLNNQHIKVTDVSQYPPDHPPPPIVPLMGPPLGHIYEEESLSSVPSYMRVPTSSSSPSCPLLDPTLANYLPLNSNPTMPVAESSAILAAATTGGGLFFGAEFPQVQELEYQGDSGRLFCPDALPRVYNCSNELQALSNESQHLVSATGCSNPLASDITSLDDPSFSNNVVKCSPEERREKINRYMKKRNERNFSKKIKYACRKTLADSRPRVRGRFAKNDEFGEANKATSCGTHEDDTKEDVKLNLLYHHDPNMITSSGHENNGRIFTSNCHSSNSPYDICPPLYCTDGQLH